MLKKPDSISFFLSQHVERPELVRWRAPAAGRPPSLRIATGGVTIGSSTVSTKLRERLARPSLKDAVISGHVWAGTEAQKIELQRI